MKILILGANGQLGRSLVEGLSAHSSATLIPASRNGHLSWAGQAETVDLVSPESLTTALDRTQPEIIINAAAYTAVDQAEVEEPIATRINGDAVGLLGCWAQTHRALVVHYSTDYVFDGGSERPYGVDSPTNPICAYGRSKLAGERALAARGARHFIFRTSWVYSPYGHNFLKTMLRLGATQEELRIVSDQRGAPTSTSVIVAGTSAALKRWQEADTAERKNLEGIHHLAAGGSATWLAFAEAIFDEAKSRSLLSRVPRLIAVRSADFNSRATRPAWSVLDTSSFTKLFGYVPPPWQTCLSSVMNDLANQLQESTNPSQNSGPNGLVVQGDASFRL
jgi:dTDP-4-dehydrorhamnose reductase